MDISPIISSSIVQTGLFGTSSVQPVTFLFSPSATTNVSSVDIVDISGLGQLLSASSIFESGILKAAATNQSSFTTVVAATQFFVDAFNSFLQSDSLQSSSGGSLGNLFTQMLNTQTTAGSGNGKSIIPSLSEIGINFQAPTSQNTTGLMAIDFETLQSAFNADQLGTVSLLTQTTQSIGQLATEFTNLFVRVSDLTQDSQSLTNIATLNGLLAATAATETTAATTPAAATLSATGSIAATELITTPIAIRLPTTTALPTTPVTVATAPMTGAPTAMPQNLFNPIIDASNPAVAAAIAAYHVVDGIFDSSKSHGEASSASFPGYSEILPAMPVQTVKLDLYA